MKTKCSDFEDRLSDILVEALPPADLRVAMEHLAECPRCRQLLEVARGEMDLLPSGSRQELAREILRKTSGLACGRGREQLCDFVDGRLPHDDARILAIHIENCKACAGLARILEELSAALPGMAELDPGAPFTREVLAATSRRERCKPQRREFLAEWWNAVMRRPRFAWEAAYVGTLLLALVIGNPALMSMAASTPLDEVRGKTRQAWATATRELTGLSSAATSGAAEAAGRLSQKVSTNPVQARESAARLWQKGQGWAEHMVSLDFARIRDWSARVLRMVRDSWMSLGLDRTFS